jgi:hypothetical protein
LLASSRAEAKEHCRQPLRIRHQASYKLLKSDLGGGDAKNQRTPWIRVLLLSGLAEKLVCERLFGPLSPQLCDCSRDFVSTAPEVFVKPRLQSQR